MYTLAHFTSDELNFAGLGNDLVIICSRLTAHRHLSLKVSLVTFRVDGVFCVRGHAHNLVGRFYFYSELRSLAPQR